MRIKFIDLNLSLVNEVKKLGIEAIHGDYFLESAKTPCPVLMTASNPSFTFGGGLDYYFKKNYPFLCRYKQVKGGGNERIGNICFIVSVNEDLTASKERVREAIRFGLDNTLEGETLCLSGIGTNIGGMSEDDFIKILKETI
jgi:hypothetical protein